MADPLCGIRVLVVDDHDDSRDIFAHSLAFYGAIVATALSAQDAVPLLVAADVVLTDLSMPGEDGVWLLERVNEQPRPVPVIAVTGVAEVYSARLAAAPFARKLLKPIDPMRLAEEILEVLQERA